MLFLVFQMAWAHHGYKHPDEDGDGTLGIEQNPFDSFYYISSEMDTVNKPFVNDTISPNDRYFSFNPNDNAYIITMRNYENSKKLKAVANKIDDLNITKKDDGKDCDASYNSQTPYSYLDDNGLWCIDEDEKNRAECLTANPSDITAYFGCLNESNKRAVMRKTVVDNYEKMQEFNTTLGITIVDQNKKYDEISRTVKDINDTLASLPSILASKSGTDIIIDNSKPQSSNFDFNDSRIVDRLDTLIGVNTAGFNSLNATLAGSGRDGNSSVADFGVLDFAKEAGLDGNITSSYTSTKLTNIIENSLKSAVDDDFITKVLSSFSFGIRDIFKPLEAVAYWTDISANLKGLNTTVSITYSSFANMGLIGILRIMVAFLFGILSIVHIFTRIFD